MEVKTHFLPFDLNLLPEEEDSFFSNNQLVPSPQVQFQDLVVPQTLQLFPLAPLREDLSSDGSNST